MTAEQAASPALGGASADAVHRFGAPRHGTVFWVVLWAVAALGAAGSLAQFVVETDHPVEPVQVVFRLVGASFAACGLVAWRRRPDSRGGLLMTATGFALYVSPLLALVPSPIAVTLSHLLPDLWILFFVPLVLTLLTGGRLRTRTDRVLVAAILVELLVLAPAYLVVAEYDTLLRLAPDAEVAAVVDTLQKALYLLIVAGVAAVVGSRWARASAPGRRAMPASLAGAFCLLAFGALLAVELAGRGRSTILLWIAACSLVTVPLAFLAGLLRSRLARSGLADLFRALGTMQPAQLQEALARVLHDPRFTIAFPAPGGQVGVDGRPVAPAADRSAATVVRDGVPAAELLYDPALDDDPELVDAVRAAATVALENRHLHEQAQERLAELQASRERIVTAADAERRRIERNLHDGAQQRLVTVALQLSLIRRQIDRDPDEARQLVSEAGDELARSLEELRELARGIHPAALDQGLAAALDGLAGRAAVPTTVSVAPGPRLPEAVELAAYFVASEALANTAKHAGAGAATIGVTREGPWAVVTVADDGAGGADAARGSGLRGLADRVEALGGRLSVTSPPGEGTTVVAELPSGAGGDEPS